MNIAVDIGNTALKCGVFTLTGELVGVLRLPAKGIQPNKKFLRELLRWRMLTNRMNVSVPEDVYPEPLTWHIAQTGSFPWEKWQAAILNVRPQDKFKRVARRKIPLKVDVDSPTKVGIDRLLAAFAATGKYGDSPMMIVDAGSAITVDVVQDRIFHGGAILPGLVVQSETYPKISEKLPLVPIPDLFSTVRPVYPGRNTKEAIRNGIYWGTIGAIRQFYEMVFSNKQDVRLILTGGDAEYLLLGLYEVLSLRQITHCDTLVLEGIKRCFEGGGTVAK